MQEYRDVERKREDWSLLKDPFLFFDSPPGVPVGTNAHVLIESSVGLRLGDTGRNKQGILTAISGRMAVSLNFCLLSQRTFPFPRMLCHAFCLGVIAAFSERDRMSSLCLNQDGICIIIIISHCFRNSGQCNKRHDTEMIYKSWNDYCLQILRTNILDCLLCVKHDLQEFVHTWPHVTLKQAYELYYYHLHFTDRETKAKLNHLSCSRSWSPLEEEPQ